MIISSRLEGGANVVSEAIVLGVPILASRIDGNVGLLGDDYPAYFPVGDGKALGELIERVASDAAFLARLRRHQRRLKPAFSFKRECASWRELLEARK